MGFFSSIVDSVKAVSEDVLKYEEEGKELSIDELCNEVNKELLDINIWKRSAYTNVLKSRIRLIKNFELQNYMEEYKGVGFGTAYDVMLEEYNRRSQ